MQFLNSKNIPYLSVWNDKMLLQALNAFEYTSSFNTETLRLILYMDHPESTNV